MRPELLGGLLDDAPSGYGSNIRQSGGF